MRWGVSTVLAVGVLMVMDVLAMLMVMVIVVCGGGGGGGSLLSVDRDPVVSV
jgi:hypothetical protein